MVDNWVKAMEHAIRELNEWPDKTIQVFHHNDLDGLSSGAILTRPWRGKDLPSNGSVWRSHIRRC